MDQIELLLHTFFNKFCSIAMWVFAFKMVIEILKNANAGNIQEIIKIVLTGTLSYGCMFSIVSLLESVKNLFS